MDNSFKFRNKKMIFKNFYYLVYKGIYLYYLGNDLRKRKVLFILLLIFLKRFVLI